MLKQNKNSNFRENSNIIKRYQNKKFVKLSLTKKHKNLLRVRKTFKFKCHVGNPSFRQIFNKDVFANFLSAFLLKSDLIMFFVPCLMKNLKQLYIQLLPENVV